MKWLFYQYWKLIKEAAMFDMTNKGYTRGGLDVITGVNLFFKFLLLSPVFLLAGITTATMFKHVIFQGVPTMATPSQQQRETLREMNENVQVTGAVLEQAPYQVPEVTMPPVPVLPAPTPKLETDACSLWRQAHPTLAEELEPGDTCY